MNLLMYEDKGIRIEFKFADEIQKYEPLYGDTVAMW